MLRVTGGGNDGDHGGMDDRWCLGHESGDVYRWSFEVHPASTPNRAAAFVVDRVFLIGFPLFWGKRKYRPGECGTSGGFFGMVRW